jgi:hypothetical protein
MRIELRIEKPVGFIGVVVAQRQIVELLFFCDHAIFRFRNLIIAD